MKKLILNTLILGTTLFTLISAGKSDSVIKIGVAGPHSGDLAPYGLPTLNEAQRLAEMANANGGINGKLIKIIPADDVCDPGQSANLASKLVDNGVVAVIGHICSGATESALPTYTNANIPVISPSATNPSLTKSGKYPIFFRTVAPDDAQGIKQADFIIDFFGVSTVAIIHDNQDYGKGIADNAKIALEAKGVSIPIYEGISVGAGDYSAIVAKIVSNDDIEVLIFGGYHPEGSKLINQLRDRGYIGAFVSGDGLYSTSFIKLVGDAAEGVFVTGPQDGSDSDVYKQAITGYKEKYGQEPGSFFDEGHSAFQIIYQAIESLGDKDVSSDAVLEAIRSGSFSTLIGDISFNEYGDANGVGFNVYEIEQGKFRLFTDTLKNY